MTEPLKSAHAPLLNRLSEMQAAPYYATARDTLAQAERVIVQLEEEVAVDDKLLAERNRVLAAIPACTAHGDQCVPHALAWLGAATRACEIADESMYELLLSEALGSGENELEFYHRNGADSTRIKTIAETYAHIREAFEWLQPRGYVELGKDEEGEFIRVLKRPGATA